MGDFMRWLIQSAIAIDQTVNAVLFSGMADETLSARSYRKRYERRWLIAYNIINMLFFWQHDHCEEAFESEIKRRHLPVFYRSND